MSNANARFRITRASGRRAGNVTTALIVAAVIVVVAIIAWYFTSDVFRTRVDAAADQYTKWTPENIAKDPVNYLNFAEAETKKAMEALKANEIAIAQNRGKLEGMRDEAQNKINIGERSLNELKELYVSADSTGSFPVQWQGQPREEDFVKRQVVALHKQVQTQRNLLAKVEQGLKSLEVQLAKVHEARGQAQEQLAEINANRELLKVEKITGDLTNQLVAMKGALQATVNTASETSTVVSLDQLAAESEAAVDDAEFEKIMGSGGEPETPPVQ